MLAPADGALHRPAAVLIPIIARGGEATVLLTHRSAHLKDHPGQIAFPGGKMALSDATPIHTALREAKEEIGLEGRFVEPIGYLDPYLSSTGFRIIPVVAIIDPEHQLVIDPNEVESTFEVPLGFLMDPTHHEQHTREWRGAMRRYYAMPYGEHYIWGVTAGIIRTLYERVYGE
jgi:8-oxo-dGTP pyrophosphatase MutT (NUDIX family)